MLFEITLEKRALQDLEKGVEYYNEQQKGLGKRQGYFSVFYSNFTSSCN